MNDFTEELKRTLGEANNGYCSYPGCINLIHSIHHKLPNTVYNQKKFPLFLQSPFNGVALCLECHTNNAHKYKITDKQAELYEKWLNELIEKNHSKKSLKK